MDVLKSQLARISEQLKGLSASQKMLAGALVTIMVMTLLFWGNVAGKAEMETLLETSLSPADLNQITSRLKMQGIAYQVTGDRIVVPTDKKYEVIADLGFAQLLPQDTASTFDQIVAKLSPFDGSKKQDALLNHSKEQFLSTVMRRWPRVASAAVIIDATHARGPGKIEPSATVDIRTRSGETSVAKLVEAAADLVSGAVANMPRSRVKVIVDSMPQRVRDRDSQSPGHMADDYLAYKREAERHHMEKLLGYLQFITSVSNVSISVTCEPNFKKLETVRHEVDPKNVFQKEVDTENTTEEMATSERPAGDVGAVPNGPLAITPAAAGAGDSNTSTTDRNRSSFMVDVGKTDTKTWDPGGDVRVISASVLIPRSYFMRVYKGLPGKADQDPDDNVLQPFISRELETIKKGVRNCLGGATLADTAMNVDWYADVMPVADVGPAAASSSMALMVGSHVKEITLGVLALVSLLMVSSMVKKGSSIPALAAVGIGAPPATGSSRIAMLASGEEVAGEATLGNPLLDGMELDEESVKSHEMLNQVTNMVGENPDAAANLVKRWLNRQ